MLDELRRLQAEGDVIRVGLIGAGAMGVGIAWQVARTPGMELAFVADLRLDAAAEAVAAAGAYARTLGEQTARAGGDPSVLITDDALRVLRDGLVECDVLVESTNTIGAAASYCFAAIERGMHVILMNAEVDLALGPLLQHEAKQRGVIVTSDAGDQHGVLARMMEEIEMWNFRLVQAGNIKGFLDRHATAETLIEEAAKRNLSPIQCCAYTDGTKLNIEMAIISNARNMPPLVDGMEGPACADVHQVLDAFDFDAYGDVGRVDYILGAEPGGGVYVVAHCDDPLQARYLRYYKLGSAPYYLFYRPYHLCHLETTRAIALASLYGKPVLTPRYGRVADVYAYAKRDLKAGETVEHGIGGEHVYGLIRPCDQADTDRAVPISLMEAEGTCMARVLRDAPIDSPLTLDDIELPDTNLCRLFAKQERLLAEHV